ncbi:BMC domain-containing protein [Sodalis ligni]|uniref:BMC domain-containing protein n=1 Tax=Sodalis ligni TaxID=2697027 RepID=UPI00193F5A14|nr:BMC domain-containing protein [Sodalis ligni]QWA09303.1 BMC domain-containing protein [Sodalis ligni]
MQHSLGLIEVTGLSLAITVADAMAKTASVGLLGVERTIGSGWMLVKIHGDVASVRTALSAGEEMARSCSGFVACTTIARPATGTSEIISASLRQDNGIKEDVAGDSADAETPDADGDAAPDPAGSTGVEDSPAAVAAETTAPSGDGASAPAGAIAIGENPQAAAVETVLVSSAERPEFTDTLTRTVSTVQASAGVLPATCKICGDPLCGRQKGEPRSKCIHYQKTVLR